MDREKVIKWLHQHCECSLFDRCGECPYYEFSDEQFSCRDRLLEDVLFLLKEQEKPNGKCVNECECWDSAYERGKQDALKEQEAVVQCKDCKYRSYYCTEATDGTTLYTCHHPCANSVSRPGYWFCADGERRVKLE